MHDGRHIPNLIETCEFIQARSFTVSRVRTWFLRLSRLRNIVLPLAKTLSSGIMLSLGFVPNSVLARLGILPAKAIHVHESARFVTKFCSLLLNVGL